MDYSDCQDETITVYTYTQKEKEPLESGDNVYYSDGYDEPDPNQYYTPAPADYYIPYIFRPY